MYDNTNRRRERRNLSTSTKYWHELIRKGFSKKNVRRSSQHGTRHLFERSMQESPVSVIFDKCSFSVSYFL